MIVPAVQQQQQQYPSQGTIHHLNRGPHSSHRHLPINATKEEYQKYKESFLFQVGSYVTFKYVQNSDSLLRYSFVWAAREEVPMNVVVDWQSGLPKTFLLVQLDIDKTTPWIRWDTGDNYRLPSTTEFMTTLDPRRDQLRNYLQRLRELPTEEFQALIAR